MKIAKMARVAAACAALGVVLAACETLEALGLTDSSGAESSESSESGAGKQPSYKKDSADADSWDIATLDTAHGESYLYDVEKNVILEMNKARTNPKKYAELYIAPRAKKFSGNLYDGYLMTNEGAAMVNECVKYMSSLKALPALAPAEGLTRAAKDHAETQCLTDQTGHTGTDGSDPFERMNRYGTFSSAAGENISYGEKSARDIVVSLLIDDGVPNRGHRKNILSKDFTTAGVGYADKHKLYGAECVIDFAGGWAEK